jgi:hypothetical protein
MGFKEGIRAADNKALKHKASPPPPVETTDDEIDSKAEQSEVNPAPLKSETDNIAEVWAQIGSQTMH